MSRHPAGLLIALLLLPAAAFAGEEAVWNLPAAQFDDPLGAGTLSASIRWGEIRVTGHDAARVEVDVRVTPENSSDLGWREVRDAVDVELLPVDGNLELVIDSRLAGFYGVALEIRVPRAANLRLEVTDGGEIFVDSVDGDVDVHNRNGSVKLVDLGSAAVVHARNGSIEAGFARVDPDAPMAFSSLNGSVDVTLPGDVAADLRIRYARGGIESDFDVRTSRGSLGAVDGGDMPGRVTRLFEGTIGGGGPRYSFQTANGTVYLRKR